MQNRHRRQSVIAAAALVAGSMIATSAADAASNFYWIGGTADLSDITSARSAAARITALGLSIGGLLNNAGIFPAHPSTSAQGWDTAFATNHLGPFTLTEALLPTLTDGANVVFVVSAVEDPERRIAVHAGFRGGRYLSAEASAPCQSCSCLRARPAMPAASGAA